MKHLVLFVVAIASLVVPSFAADEKHTFTGEITGVVCAACKEHVSSALREKIPAIEKIEITKGEKEGVNTITIVAKQADMTKDTAMAALGDLGKTYQITSLAPKK